jgi:ankyrin repeat protein
MRPFILALFVVVALVSRSCAQESDADLVRSTLLESTLRGDFDAIRAALDNGESIDVVNDKGWSAARFAVAGGDTGTLRFLIENRIDLNNADNEGITPLMAAAQDVRDLTNLLCACCYY